ncbi:MAG: ComF family protein [Bacteroidales bacterium]|nr:ComF family protein [Bacteroidales bacterium]
MKRIHVFNTFTESLLHLFYPNICAGCGMILLRNENTICINCYTKLEFRNDVNEEENPVAQLFYGKIIFHHAMALLHYHKQSLIQKLLFDLKYHQKPNIGWWLGRMMAIHIQNSPFLKDVEILIPVPLHPKKLRARGYNQSQVICEGILDVLPHLSLETDAIIRSIFTETQTRKNTWQRFQNVKEVFLLKKPDRLKNKHILIVDDVITTGSTMEACAKKILQVEGTKVSFAAVASPV